MTVSDRRKGTDTNADTFFDVYDGVEITATDYFPFGLEMPGRTFQATSYRYGFNGKENDRTSWSGTQLVQDYGNRLYSPAIGKFLSVDPIAKEYPWNSPYAFAENDILRSIDIDGLEKWIVNSSPKPFYGPYKDLREAENAAWKYNNVPQVRGVEIKSETQIIRQTGFATNNNQTTITIVDVNTTDNQAFRFVGMRAGIDVDVDGIGPAHGASQDPNTSLRMNNGSSLNADNLSYSTYPTILNTEYCVNSGSLSIVTGPSNRGRGRDISVPAIVGDNSGDHGGELSVKAAKQFGYATLTPIGLDGNDRVANYTYWFVIGTQAEKTEKGIKDSQQTTLMMGLLFQARQAINDAARGAAETPFAPEIGARTASFPVTVQERQ